MKERRRKYIMNWDEVPVILDLGYIAMVLGCSRENARKLCADNVIPSFKVGAMWRVKKHDLMKFCGEVEAE